MPDRLYTTVEVARELGIHRSRVARIARRRGLGTPYGPQGWRLFTESDIDNMRVRRPGPWRPEVKPMTATINPGILATLLAEGAPCPMCDGEEDPYRCTFCAHPLAGHETEDEIEDGTEARESLTACGSCNCYACEVCLETEAWSEHYSTCAYCDMRADA